MEILINSLNKIIDSSNDLLWSYFLIYLLIGAGLYFTYKLRFIQILHFKHILEIMSNSRKGPKGEISSFQSFCTGLGARVGSGNIAGVAVAIHLGGPGSIFWMWVIALLGMSTGFIEGTLAQLYKEKSSSGGYIGGPAYYITKGLKSPFLGTCFALSLILAFGLIFNAVQANTLVEAVHEAFRLEKLTIGVVLCLATAYVITGGIKRISRFSEIFVPFMAIAYLLLAVIILALNFQKIPGLFSTIFSHAFNLESASSGFLGYGILAAVENGTKRGLFSNEAGMGSTANAAATASPLPRHPASQGYIQMFSIFVDTIIVCSVSAFIILLSDIFTQDSSLTGIALAQASLASQIGKSGYSILALLLLFFAFTSIAANYSYAESNLLYISKKKRVMILFRFAMIAMVMFGALSKVELVWTLADSAMGIMTLINLSALLLLSRHAINAARDYNDKRKKGVELTFKSKKFSAWK